MFLTPIFQLLQSIVAKVIPTLIISNSFKQPNQHEHHENKKQYLNPSLHKIYSYGNMKDHKQHTTTTWNQGKYEHNKYIMHKPHTTTTWHQKGSMNTTNTSWIHTNPNSQSIDYSPQRLNLSKNSPSRRRRWCLVKMIPNVKSI